MPAKYGIGRLMLQSGKGAVRLPFMMTRGKKRSLEKALENPIDDGGGDTCSSPAIFSEEETGKQLAMLAKGVVSEKDIFV